ncbi:hypothetical protein F2P79_010327 [Pimephales promelas]|nr:hypothetical protein F2P79_010327 [Pimephales promelas]
MLTRFMCFEEACGALRGFTCFLFVGLFLQVKVFVLNGRELSVTVMCLNHVESGHLLSEESRSPGVCNILKRLCSLDRS